jgi:glutathione peroxidase
MKSFIFIISTVSIVFLWGCNSQKQPVSTSVSKPPTDIQPNNIYGFTVTDLDGVPFDFRTLKGKKVMIVNTASECGNTPQYKDLQMIWEKYKNDNLVVIGFPANNFGGQEPGSDEEIATFCEKNYGVTFPMMSKISVKGDDMHPLYQFLTQKEKNGKMDSEVKWNFQKYLINEKGELEKVIDPKKLVTDAEVVAWIEE